MTDNASGARRRAIRIAALAFTALAPAPFAGAAHAQTEVAEKSFNLDIPAQTLARSMATLSTQTGLQVVYADDAPLATNAPAVKGRMTVEQALARLTAGTGFTYRFTGPGVVTLVKVPVGNGADGEVVTGVVSVEGVQGSGSPYFGGAGQAAGVNGINGSRDITATEGTGSFTSGALTIGSKVPQALKDVPQSVSVLTSARLEQQNVTDFTTAMKQLPGVALVQGNSSLETTFYSRGFAINSIQIDGGAALLTGGLSSQILGYFPQIDMSQYDHVELLRGAAGLFNGYGDPGGTVNLVRKKPLDHSQVALEAQVGSWQNYRFVADATSLLAFDGKLRGRVVMTYQNNRYFYDTAKDDKVLLYGIAELDLTPSTLITGGVSYTKQNSVPWLYGLPRYQTGADLELPRSTSFVLPWNRWNFDNLELFGGVEQRFGDEWIAKINVTHSGQSSIQKLAYSNLAVNPLNGTGPVLQGSYNVYRSDQLTGEGTVSGAFNLFGNRQELVLGFNYANADGGGQYGYDPVVNANYTPYQPYPGGPVYCLDYGIGYCPTGSIAANGPPIDVFDFDRNDPLYTEPQNPLAGLYIPVLKSVRSGAYITARLTFFDRVHVTTGLRVSWYKSAYEFDYLCNKAEGSYLFAPQCAGKNIGDVYGTSAVSFSDRDFSWPPPVNVSYDITDSLSAYAGYTDIYQSQASRLDANHNPLAPITGSNIEGGLKWAARGGRLNVSASAYKIEKNGYSQFDSRYPFEQIAPGVYCCYVANPDRSYNSQGFDIEITGEVLPGFQLSSSVNYNETKQEGDYFGDGKGQPFVSIQPKLLYRAWASYDFGAAGRSGWLAGLTLSAGVNGQSSAYYAGTVCVNLGPPDPVSGVSDCLSYSPPDYVPYEFTVPAYAVFSARVDYDFSDKWSLAVNVENLLDKTYYQSVGSDPNTGNWYGTPRSFTATLRAKW